MVFLIPCHGDAASFHALLHPHGYHGGWNGAGYYAFYLPLILDHGDHHVHDLNVYQFFLIMISKLHYTILRTGRAANNMPVAH